MKLKPLFYKTLEHKNNLYVLHVSKVLKNFVVTNKDKLKYKNIKSKVRVSFSRQWLYPVKAKSVLILSHIDFSSWTISSYHIKNVMNTVKLTPWLRLSQEYDAPHQFWKFHLYPLRIFWYIYLIRCKSVSCLSKFSE